MSNSENKNLISKVIVENFPSRVELYEILDRFLLSNNYSKDYHSDNKDSSIHFSFKNPVSFNFYPRTLHMNLSSTLT